MAKRYVFCCFFSKNFAAYAVIDTKVLKESVDQFLNDAQWGLNWLIFGRLFRSMFFFNEVTAHWASWLIEDKWIDVENKELISKFWYVEENGMFLYF